MRGLLLLLTLGLTLPAAEPVKVVVVTMFERGEDTGDEPGEFQLWVEREKLTKVYAAGAGYHRLRGNGKGLLGIVTGVGTARAASSVMALGMDERFDLRKAYWVIAGIAGIDPQDASVGSAAWAEWVADSDLAFELDAREIPKEWTTGVRPLSRGRGMVFQLDAKLVDWAYQLTKDTRLEDTEALKKMRGRFKGYPNGQKPPFVLKGDSISGGRFWHGKLMNDWANGFLKELTDGKANFVTTAMEDSGTLQALTQLTQAGRADVSRVLVLRTGSNYSMQPPDSTAYQSWQSNATGHYSGFMESLEAAYRVGSAAVHELLKR